LLEDGIVVALPFAVERRLRNARNDALGWPGSERLEEADKRESVAS
jgi:hypothetical protein